MFHGRKRDERKGDLAYGLYLSCTRTLTKVPGCQPCANQEEMRKGCLTLTLVVAREVKSAGCVGG
jgi:hypothetical protein